jgi:hypothetical protein
MLMLIDTPDARRGGPPDPDEERERRWEPVGARLFLPAAGSMSCIIASGLTPPVVAYLLDAIALLLCLYIARAEWRARDREPEA